MSAWRNQNQQKLNEMIFFVLFLLIHSIWYDFWELRVIMVRCSSTDRLVKFELVFWVEELVDLLCLNTEVDCCWFWFKWLSPSLSPPLDVARRKRSRDSLKLGPLSIVCCCAACCWWWSPTTWCCCWLVKLCCWNDCFGVLNFFG